MSKKAFIKGLDLSELFYEEAVKPVLAAEFPELIYSAALLGKGSEILGFDTAQSMDHDWGPRLMLFLREGDVEAYRPRIERVLQLNLPPEIEGYPTNFGYHEDGTTVMEAVTSGPVHHRVMVLSARGFFRYVLNFDPTEDIQVEDWVSTPEYFLLMLTAGRVYHDGLGLLELMRARLSYYPDEVWLYLLASQWRRIAQEEAFVARAGQVGDELGSRLIAARLVRDLMRLCFLIERTYAPYVKWLGSAFRQLPCAGRLNSVFMRILDSGSWQERQKYLTTAYETVAEMHNSLGITDPLDTAVRRYYSRPFLVLDANRFTAAIRAVITSEEVLALPEHLGGVDQFIDSTDALHFVDRFRAFYRDGMQSGC